METTYAEQYIKQFNYKLAYNEKCSFVDGEIHLHKTKGDWDMTFIYPIDNDHEGLVGEKRAILVYYKGENLLALEGEALIEYETMWLDEAETGLLFVLGFRLDGMRRMEQEEETK